MNCNRGNSGAFDLLQSLAKIWMPAAKAIELKQNMAVCSLEESQAAAERAGCEVCYADLPSKVSGFATMIDGQSYIVLNRDKPPQNLKYTLPHELGHSVLHLNPTRGGDDLGFPVKGLEELEAHLFAAMWVLGTTNHKEREEVLRHNQEAGFVLIVSAILSLNVVLIAALAHFFPRLFGGRSSGAATGK